MSTLNTATWKQAQSEFKSLDLDMCRVSPAAHLLLRKEVIQPQLPLRLPCYDLAPVISITLGVTLLAVR